MVGSAVWRVLTSKG